MGGRRAAERRDRGGDGIPALRAHRARLTLAASAVAVYGGVLAYVVVHKLAIAGVTGALGGIGALVLAWVLLRHDDLLLWWSLGLLGLAYAISLFVHPSGIDGPAPLVGAGLLLCGELVAWANDERHPVAADPAVVAGHAAALGALVIAGLAAGGLVLALSGSPVAGGFGWTVLGAAAAVAVVGLAARLGREH